MHHLLLLEIKQFGLVTKLGKRKQVSKPGLKNSRGEVSWLVLKTALGSVSQMLVLYLNMFCLMVYVAVCTEDYFVSSL